MDKLTKALKAALEDEKVPSRVRDQVRELLFKLDSLSKQGKGGSRQPKS